MLLLLGLNRIIYKSNILNKKKTINLQEYIFLFIFFVSALSSYNLNGD